MAVTPALIGLAVMLARAYHPVENRPDASADAFTTEPGDKAILLEMVGSRPDPLGCGGKMLLSCMALGRGDDWGSHDLLQLEAALHEMPGVLNVELKVDNSDTAPAGGLGIITFDREAAPLPPGDLVQIPSTIQRVVITLHGIEPSVDLDPPTVIVVPPYMEREWGPEFAGEFGGVR